MLIEVCDSCQERTGLIDILADKKVLCRRCFDRQYKLQPWTISFEGNLHQFGEFVDWLKVRS